MHRAEPSFVSPIVGRLHHRHSIPGSSCLGLCGQRQSDAYCDIQLCSADLLIHPPLSNASIWGPSEVGAAADPGRQTHHLAYALRVGTRNIRHEGA